MLKQPISGNIFSVRRKLFWRFLYAEMEFETPAGENDALDLLDPLETKSRRWYEIAVNGAVSRTGMYITMALLYILLAWFTFQYITDPDSWSSKYKKVAMWLYFIAGMVYVGMAGYHQWHKYHTRKELKKTLEEFEKDTGEITHVKLADLLKFLATHL